MILYKFVKPMVYPWNSAREPEQVNRLQNISGDLTLNREKLFEIGREDILGFRKQTPSLSFSGMQFEYGSMEFWYDLANKLDPETGDNHYVTLDDLSDKKCELATFLTDESDVFAGTLYLPNVRINGFSINIGDPDSILERNFDLVSEKYRIIDENYLAYNDAEVGSEGDEEITLDPVAIEYATGKYIYRVLRVRAGVVSNLEEGAGDNQWSYVSGTAKLTVKDCETGDIIKVYYAAATASTIPAWTDKDTDPEVLLADYCEIRMKVGTGAAARIYRLQSVGMDVAFDRADYKEIGNNEIVQTGVKTKTVTISLNRFLENFTLEEILAGETGKPDIDPEEFATDIQVQILVYGNKEHSGDIKIGYLSTGMTPSSTGFSDSVEEYMNKTTALEGEALKISDDSSELAFI